jgi:hypothetical protein
MDRDKFTLFSYTIKQVFPLFLPEIKKTGVKLRVTLTGENQELFTL